MESMDKETECSESAWIEDTILPTVEVQTFSCTIEQNGGASNLLLESLNPRGCAERTSELRL